jgi:cytochrome b subunit of formate dehydrogenase
MDYFLTWGHSPWGQQILTHVSWNLLWASLFAGVAFFVAHASYMVLSAHRKRGAAETDAMEAMRPDLPPRIKRHSLGARAFHWVMASSMLTLLLTAFLPIAGVRFAWVTWHWMAGLVLATSILFHVIHASFWLDFWSIWVGPKDLPELRAEIMRELGHDVPGPKPGKYPLGNRLYHLAIVVAGLSVIASGLTMMVRIRTPLFPRNPYLLGDSTWGLVYVTHGMAGVGLVGLVIAHVYFAVRPEKWWITKAMILGWITRRQYLEHHDPQRWVVGRDPNPQIPNAKSQVAQ